MAANQAIARTLMNRAFSDRRFPTGDALIKYAASLVLRRGEESAPRGMRVKELSTPVVLTLTNVHRPFLANATRRANYRFGLAEAAWILSGSEDAQLIGGFNRQMLKFSDDGYTLWGAYGPRLMGQIDHVISSLSRDKDSRQAVVTTWRPQVHYVNASADCLAGNVGGNRYLHAAGVHTESRLADSEHKPDWDGFSWRTKDTPCTVAWHFQVRNGRLNLTVFMRSNDVWLGLPYDLLSFTTVQRVVASVLGIDPGEYHHVVSNLHLYEQHWDKAGAMTTSVVRETVPLEPFGGAFHGLMSDGIRARFARVFDPGRVARFDDALRPFHALIERDEELWPPATHLMESNGRSLHPTPK